MEITGRDIQVCEGYFDYSLLCIMLARTLAMATKYWDVTLYMTLTSVFVSMRVAGGGGRRTTLQQVEW